MSERLADLDELVLRCRDKATKEYIQEAVACYRAGAFRSCIVATWNAIVFDFIHKLRELEQTKHKDAIEKLEEFEKIRKNTDISKILTFEKSVPDMALKDFEFISPLEHSDLKRLLEDRNLCAHPSMRSLEETFPASAELARYHLRNAVTHLLQHPPVQGRAALDSIWDQIRSELFPTDVELAVISLRHGPLARARKPLIRGVIVGLTRSLLLDDRTKAEQTRQFAALQAVVQIHFEASQEFIKAELSKTAEGISDQGWPKVISYLRYIKAYEALNEACQTKAKTLIQKVNDAATVSVLLDALNVEELKPIALERVRQLPPEVLVQEFQDILQPDEILPIVKDYIQLVVNLFIESSYIEAQANGKALLQVAPLLSANQLKIALDAFCSNDQLYYVLGLPEILQELFGKTLHLAESVKTSWRAVRQMLDKENFANLSSVAALKERIDQQFPNLIQSLSTNEQEGES
jgi:hypothetical protein